MSAIQLILAVLAIGYVAGQYLQERAKLAALGQMSGQDARRFYEKGRRKYERFLLIFTVFLCTSAAGTLIYSYVVVRP